MPRVKCRLSILALLCVAPTALAGREMAIIAPVNIEPDSQVMISWSGGQASYTVKVLVNSRRKNETKSIGETKLVWGARGLKDGDEVQFYVYDSSGASAKSPQIPVQGKAGPVTDESSSGKEESKTKQHSIGTLSPSGPTGEQAGVDTSSGTTATRTRSGRIPTAPPPSSDVPTASAASAADYPSLTSNGPSAAESLSSGTGAATGEATPSLTLAATASAATTTTTAGSAASPKPQDRTYLFLGLIGILIALALLLALVWYVRG